jgi:hypothetical protein
LKYDVVYIVCRKEQFGDRSPSGIAMVLQLKQDLFEQLGIEIKVIDNPLTIAIVTPIMRRAHSLQCAGEIVFVDSSGSCDQGGSTVTFLFTACKTGGIPLGVVIHESQSESNYKQAFDLLLNVIGPNGFGKKGQPSVVMTDDSAAERSALKQVFPLAELLLCAFHICQAMWRWLWDSNHRISNTDKQQLMHDFRLVVFEHDTVQVEELFKGLIMSRQAKQYPHFITYVGSLWLRRKEWCLSFRTSLQTKGNNTNNIVEASIRIFKDIVLDRCRAFNAAALVDFICNILESYHQRRLLKFASCKVTGPELHYRRFCSRAATLTVVSVSNSTFHVTSATDDQLLYTVSTADGVVLCDCYAGQGGAFCKHICAVALAGNAQCIAASPKLSFVDRVEVAKLALGDVEESFFQNMNGDDDLHRDGTRHPSVDTEDFHSSMIVIDATATTSNDQLHTSQSSQQNDLDIELGKFGANTARLVSLLSTENSSSYLHRQLKLLNKTMDNITTPSAFIEFCSRMNSCRRTRRLIGVQPTAKSRRLSRHLTAGAKRIQAGRPAKAENVRPKRKRCLAASIAANHPNAKSH